MSHLKEMQKTYHITDDQLNGIRDVLEEVRDATEHGRPYSYQQFEQKVLKIVPYNYSHHIAQDLAKAFLLDERYEAEIVALYENEASMKSLIEDWKEKKSGEVL